MGKTRLVRDSAGISGRVAGIQITEHFPSFAKQMQHAVILRDMSTLKSDHKLVSDHLHGGYSS